MNYLFICNGNVARSQEAEAFFNAKKTSEADTAQSAGINVKLGKPIDPLVVEVMNEIGYDVSGAVRKFVDEDMVADSDKIISFKPVEELPDPQHQPIEFHRAVRDNIAARVLNLVANK